MDILVNQMKWIGLMNNVRSAAGKNAPHFKILMQNNSCYDIILIV